MDNVLLRTSVDATQDTMEPDVKHVRFSCNTRSFSTVHVQLICACSFQQFAWAIFPAANVDSALLQTNATATKDTMEVNRDAGHVRIIFNNRIRAFWHKCSK